MSFDYVAPFYSSLSRKVFGHSLFEAKSCFLANIGSNSKVLIIGGGDGDILPLIHHDAIVTFIEPSAKMLNAARAHQHPGTTFIQKSFQEFSTKISYDYIIVHCFLDLFSNDELHLMSHSIKQLKAPGGQLLVTDFVGYTWWHRLYLLIMYRFFRLTTGLRNQKIPAWQEILARQFRMVSQKSFYRGFIISAQYV